MVDYLIAIAAGYYAGIYHATYRPMDKATVDIPVKLAKAFIEWCRKMLTPKDESKKQ